MKNRRGFLKTLGLGAVSAGPLAAAAIANRKEIDKAITDAVNAPAKPEQIETLTKALEHGVVNHGQVSDALGFAEKDRCEAIKKTHQLTEAHRDKFEQQLQALSRKHAEVGEHYPKGWSKEIVVDGHATFSPQLGQLLSLGGATYTLIELLNNEEAWGPSYKFLLDRPLETPVTMGHRVVMRSGRFDTYRSVKDVDMSWPITVEVTRPNGLKESLTARIKLSAEGVVNYLCDTMFTSRELISDWRLGFIDNIVFTALSDCDKYRSHLGWDEFTGYETRIRPWSGEWQRIRPQWRCVDQSEIRISDTGVIKGLFVCGSYNINCTQTIGNKDKDGILLGTCLFDQGDLVVVRGDVLKIGQ